MDQRLPQLLRSAPGRPHGLTLMELMVAVAMLAVLGVMAGPPMGGMLARHRVQAAAAQLGADLGETRHEATRRGGKVYVNFHGSSDWCYVITTDPAATCATDSERVLKRVRAKQLPGVTLSAAQPVVFDGASGMGPAVPVQVQLSSARGDLVSVQVGLLGRAKVCSPDGALKALPRC
jgi:prepilin-type N-terminal cleavage/methylation domain-containing protein